MTLQYSTSVASSYNQQLQNYFDKINNNTISQSEINQAKEVATQYYTYLGQSSVEYGDIAIEVIQSSSFFGAFANGMLQDAIQENNPSASDSQIQFEKDKIAISLAYEDSLLRQETNDGNLTSREIADYHYDVFVSHNLPKEAWGGALFEEFIGAGSWIELRNNQEEFINSLASASILNNKNLYSNEISFFEALIRISDFSSSKFASGQLLENFATDLANKITDLFLDLNADANTISDAVDSGYQSFVNAVLSAVAPRDPLIVDTNNDGLSLSNWQSSGVRFDMDGNGTSENTGWTTPSNSDYQYSQGSGSIIIDAANANLINRIVFGSGISLDDLTFSSVDGEF